MQEQICESCGKIFKAYKSNHRKYCSQKCRLKELWNIRKRREYIKIICKQCGKEFDVGKSDYRVKHNTIKYCSQKCSGEALKKGKLIKCKQCGKEFYSTRNMFCSSKCFYDYKKENYKHKEYEENGYIVLYKNGYNKKGNAKQHVLIMENYLGRRLNKNEVVHHIDGNKKNNDISNLKLMTRAEHSRFHRKQDLLNGKKLFEYKYQDKELIEV